MFGLYADLFDEAYANYKSNWDDNQNAYGQEENDETIEGSCKADFLRRTRSKRLRNL